MITIAIFRKMASDHVAGLTADKDFFVEELPLQKDGKPAQGAWLVTRSGSVLNTPKGLNQHSTIDFYVAYNNKAKADAIHQQIMAWIRENQVICSLSGIVGGSSYSFSNIRLNPATTPQNMGATENGNIVKLASANIAYDINQ